MARRLAHSQSRRLNSRGFTRPEGLILFGFILVVITMVWTGLVAVRQHQRLTMAKSDLAALIEAGNWYYREYGVWPTGHTNELGDVRYGQATSNREILNVLRAQAGPGNENHAVNPRRIVFLEVAPYSPGLSGLNSEGEFLDPWGTPYQVVLDADLNNTCELLGSIYGRLIGEGMVAWCCGPDRTSDTQDDLLSWKKRISE